MQFSSQPTAADPASPFGPTWFDLLSRHGGRLLLVTAFLGLALVLRHSLARLFNAAAPAGAVGRRRGAGGGDPALPRFGGLPDLSDQMIEDVQEYAAENPARIAEYVQSWIYEEDQRRERVRPAGGKRASV
jgi:hypothetical protein